MSNIIKKGSRKQILSEIWNIKQEKNRQRCEDQGMEQPCPQKQNNKLKLCLLLLLMLLFCFHEQQGSIYGLVMCL